MPVLLRRLLLWGAAIACGQAATGSLAAAPAAEVLAEEVVTRFTAANNGAGPLWCYGSPLIVRQKDVVFASISETGADVPPLCNTRWQLWRRRDGEWRVVNRQLMYREREPCPLVCLPEQGLFISANPSTTPPGTRYRACRPTVFRVPDDDPTTIPTPESPRWAREPKFTDHSYRGLAADGERRELLLLHIDSDTSEQYVSWRTGQGAWKPRGKIRFPIRAAYPQVGLRDGAAHVLAIGDIREPVEAWEKLKREKLGREWDYVFRRLFYTFTPNIETTAFQTPLEVDSVEQTAGHITNLDVHVDASGAAHLLYLKRPHQYEFLRDEYFPGQPITARLEYAVLSDGRVVERRTLAETPREGNGLDPQYARFHVGSSETLYVVVSGSLKEAGKANRIVNALQAVSPQGPPAEIDLQHPFRTFFTSTPRGGGSPTDTIDLFGAADDVPNLRYAAVRIPPPER